MSQKSRQSENPKEKLAKFRRELPDQRDKIFLGLESLKATIAEIEKDIAEKGFANRAENILAEIDGYKRELETLAGYDLSAGDLGEIQAELNDFAKKVKGLRKRYEEEVVASMVEESGREMEAPSLQVSAEEKAAEELPAPEVGEAMPRGKVSELMSAQKPEPTVLASELPIETKEPLFTEESLPGQESLPGEAESEAGPLAPPGELDGGKDRLELRMELEEKRNLFIAKKQKFEKSKGVISKVGRFFTRRRADGTQEDLEKARVDYEQARAEYIGEDIGKALDERLELVDAEVMEKIRAEQWSGNVLRYIIDGYAKLGRMNITTTEWGKKQMKKERWLGKAALRMASVRSAVNIGLVVGAGAIAGAGAAAGLTASGVLAVRRALSSVGVGGLTYDALKARAVAREEQKGLLKNLSAEAVAELSTEELLQRKQAIEARNLLDATTNRASIYKNLSEIIDNELKKRARSEGEEKEAAELKAEALRQFLDEADILANNDVLKEYQKKEKRHKAAGVASGAAVATGVAGMLFKKLGISDLFRESYEWWKEKIAGGSEQAVAVAAVEGALEKPIVEVGPEPVSEALSPEQARENFITSHYDSLVHKGEGVTQVLQRDLRVHPEHLESFRHIKGIEKIIAIHNENYSEITPKELNRAAWLIENDKEKGFGQELLVKGAPDNVAVVFDDSAGRYKIGALDDSDIMKKVYGRIEAVVEKIPGSAVEFGEVETKDEAVVEKAVREMEAGIASAEAGAGLQFPTKEEMATLEFTPEAAEKLAEAAKLAPETKTIEVPVDALPPGSVFENKEEMFGTAAPKEALPFVEESLPGEARPPTGEAGEDLQNAVLENYEKYYLRAANELTGPLEKRAGGLKHISALAMAHGDPGSADKFIAKVIVDLKAAQVFDVSNQDLFDKLASESGATDEELTRAVKDDILGRMPKEAHYLLFAEKGRGTFTMLEGGSHAMKIEDPNDSANDYFIYNDKYNFTVDESGNPIATKEGINYPIEYDFETTPPKIWIGQVKE